MFTGMEIGAIELIVYYQIGQYYSYDDFKKLRWFQTDDRKSGRNKIFLFLISA